MIFTQNVTRSRSALVTMLYQPSLISDYHKPLHLPYLNVIHAIFGLNLDSIPTFDNPYIILVHIVNSKTATNIRSQRKHNHFTQISSHTCSFKNSFSVSLGFADQPKMVCFSSMLQSCGFLLIGESALMWNVFDRKLTMRGSVHNWIAVRPAHHNKD